MDIEKLNEYLRKNNFRWVAKKTKYSDLPLEVLKTSLSILDTDSDLKPVQRRLPLVEGPRVGILAESSKKILWAWLRENGCDRNADVRRLLFGEITEEEFCRLHPGHPACK